LRYGGFTVLQCNGVTAQKQINRINSPFEGVEGGCNKMIFIPLSLTNNSIPDSIAYEV